MRLSPWLYSSLLPGLVLLAACGSRTETTQVGEPAQSNAAEPPVSTASKPSTPKSAHIEVGDPVEPGYAGEPLAIDPTRRVAPVGLQANEPFSPSTGHSPIVDEGRSFDEATIHSYRGADKLTRLEALSPVIATTERLTVVPAAIRVRTEPDALVAAWASQLGSFATGEPGLVVRANAEGVAVIDVMTGNDVGGYPILITSPARAGVVVFTLNAE